MDQVVVHLSLNHATLPRIHVFLSNMQTGLLIPRLTIADNVDLTTHCSNLRTTSKNIQKEIHSGSKAVCPAFFNPFRSNTGRPSVSVNEDAHGSKTQLRLQPEHGNEMSTFVTGGDNESTSSTETPKRNNKARTNDEWRDTNVETYGVQDTPQNHIKVQQTVEITTEPCDRH